MSSQVRPVPPRRRSRSGPSSRARRTESGVTHVTAAAPRFPRDDGTSRAGTIVLPETDGLVDDLRALRVKWRERRLGPPTAPASPREADEQEADRRQDRAHEDDPADEEGI